MSRAMVSIHFTDESVKLSANCINFIFEKDRYTPYTKAEGSFIFNYDDVDLSKAQLVKLFINGELKHEGIPDRLVLTQTSKGKILTFSSRGFTLLLGQNEPCPGINSDVNLEDIISKNISVSQISWETPTDKVNYIYVKEKSTVWDAVCAYGIKSCGVYPYIKGLNTVAVTSSDKQTDYSGTKLVSKGRGLDTTLVLSEVYMADINGDYTYHCESSAAKDMGIERKKYYPLDRQWLSDPEIGLNAKLDYSARKMNDLRAVYAGYKGEDLTDTITNLYDGINGRRISYLKVRGSAKGIFTEIRAEE